MEGSAYDLTLVNKNKWAKRIAGKPANVSLLLERDGQKEIIFASACGT